MNIAQSICEGLIESLITGKPNNNFSRESKKLLIEKKDDVIFTRNRVLEEENKKFYKYK